MTGTKGNMTSLIFEELSLGKEVTENLPMLLERFKKTAQDKVSSPTSISQTNSLGTSGDNSDQQTSNNDRECKSATEAALNGKSKEISSESAEMEAPASATSACPGESSETENSAGQIVHHGEIGSTSNASHLPQAQVQEDSASSRKTNAPIHQIAFDVYTDSDFSKTNPSMPDFRVVVLSGGPKAVLKFRDLVRLSVEAQDTTLLVAHVVDGRVRTRQVMPFSIPRYN